MGAYVAMNLSYNEGLEPMAIEEIEILGAILELPAKLYCQFGWIGSAVLQEAPKRLPGF